MEYIDNLFNIKIPSEPEEAVELPPDFVIGDADNLTPKSYEIHEKNKMAEQPLRDAENSREAQAISQCCEIKAKISNELQYLEDLEKLYVTRKRVADLQAALESSERFTKSDQNVLDVKDVEALMRPFSGDDNYSVLMWTRDFEDVMNAYDVSHMKRFIYAKRLLTGSAQLYMHNTGILNWRDLKEELIHIFKHKVSSWDVGKQLEARKIQKGESALRYFVAMCSIAMQAELAVNDVVQFIVNGLQDTTGAAASMRYCTSLDELREKLIIYDQFRQPPSAAATQNSGRRIEDVRCFNCRQMGHMMSECKRPKRPQGACFKCYSTEHQYRQCPQKNVSTCTVASKEEPKMGEDCEKGTTIAVTPLIDL